MASPSRPEPMNATSQHAKVRASLRFVERTFVSGGVVAGKMEIETKADKGLGISIIMVELLAIEELLSRDHSATQTFLHSRRMFQGPGLPASNAVHPYPLPGEHPFPADYYQARRGTTSFLFRIPLPPSSPPSISFGSGVAQIRYEVRATVGVLWKDERQLVYSKREIDVIEQYDPRSSLTKPIAAVVGENGKIWVKAEVVGEGIFSGQPACVALTVKNHSAKKNSGLTLTLTRQLILPNMPQDHPLQIRDTLTHISFRGPEYVIQPGVEGIAHLMFDVPDAARSVKDEDRWGGEDEGRCLPNLFSLRCIVCVKMTMGFGNKDIQVDLPVSIHHPSVLPVDMGIGRPLSPVYTYDPTVNTFEPSTSPIPRGMGISPVSAYPLPLTPPPIVPFIDNDRVWLPTTMAGALYHPYAVSTPPPVWPQPALEAQISPARPSSAEPLPSHPFYPDVSGLPASSVNQPLMPLMEGMMPVAEREEGKGERASRFTHHLRMSSRARSVSPQSHRYALANYNVTEPTNPLATPPRNISLHPPIQTSPSRSPSQAQLAGSATPPYVVSPRPMPSPKQVYAVDPFTHATLNKSERVEVLEQVAAETVRVNANMSSSVPDLVLQLGKTLPKPPVPSDKWKPSRNNGLPILNELFPPLDNGPNVAPPTPTLAALKSTKASHAMVNGLGGLDALEAKLLAEVGTRKVNSEKRPDVRSVLPMPITIPRPGAVPDPPIDSAISSLSLPGLGMDEGTLRMGQGSHSGGVSDREGESKIEQEQQILEASPKRSKKKGTPKAKPLDAKEKEQHKLRKAAQGRVAAWLGGINPVVSPDSAASPPQSPTQAKATDLDTGGDDQPTEQQPVEAPASSQEPIPSDTIHETAEPNPRSSGFMPLKVQPAHNVQLDIAKNPSPSRDKQVVADWRAKALGGKLPANLKFAGRTQDPEVRYDVRSARGGRGGKVAAVAAIWASATPAGSSPRPLRATPKFTSPTPKVKCIAQPPISKPAMSSAAIKPISPPVTAPATPAGDMAVRRAKLIKSTSVPAVVSSSLATPMLSSTASLARPTPTGDKPRSKTRLPPIVSDLKPSAPPKALATKNELAFGQARLRELIKKYQG